MRQESCGSLQSCQCQHDLFQLWTSRSITGALLYGRTQDEQPIVVSTRPRHVDELEQSRVRNVMDRDNYMYVKISGRNVKALIDTGAHHSCVSLSFLRRIRLQSKILNSSNHKRLFTADGKPLAVKGTLQLTLNIHGLTIPTSSSFEIFKL